MDKFPSNLLVNSETFLSFEDSFETTVYVCPNYCLKILSEDNIIEIVK